MAIRQGVEPATIWSSYLVHTMKLARRDSSSSWIDSRQVLVKRLSGQLHRINGVEVQRPNRYATKPERISIGLDWVELYM